MSNNDFWKQAKIDKRKLSISWREPDVSMLHGFIIHPTSSCKTLWLIFLWTNGRHFEICKHRLSIEYHVYIWQVSPQLSLYSTCKMWTYVGKFYILPWNIKISIKGKSAVWDFVTPTSDLRHGNLHGIQRLFPYNFKLEYRSKIRQMLCTNIWMTMLRVTYKNMMLIC